MRTRRLPTGGLAALAVLLAALAVVMVAGSPLPRTVVERVRAATTTTSVPLSRRGPHDTTSRHVVDAGVASRPSTQLATAHESPTTQRQAPPSTSTTSTTSTTTTTLLRTVTATTVPVRVSATAGPASRDGTFEAGETSVTARVGAVRGVMVSVSAGIKVTLSVACGLTEVSATAVSTATVRLDGGGGACTATFAVPPGSPQPAPWRLVTW
ncbi:MAG TPA: hypothetical protein VGZ33_03240 [Acidimicrobiales bacterium]|nr:hypothetical protein [Acidimicrobiales bacterium]